MRLLVTGGNGFLGRHVTAAAIRRGHEVRVLVRPRTAETPRSWEGRADIEVVRADLEDAGAAAGCAEGVDAVIHLAVAKKDGGNDPVAATTKATENVLSAMERMDAPRIVLASSFSVYEYLGRRDWEVLDEEAPLARNPAERDTYCRTKLAQEQAVRRGAAERGWRCVVLRPGMVYGADNLWSARLGMRLGGRAWLSMGGAAPLPLTYVENCAEALVMAVEYDGPEQDLVLNVVDGETPSQRAYLDELRRSLSGSPWRLTIPWFALRAAAGAARAVNGAVLRGKVRLPGLLDPASAHARFKPLQYPNDKIRRTLGWAPRYDWREGIQRSVSGTPTYELDTSVEKETPP